MVLRISRSTSLLIRRASSTPSRRPMPLINASNALGSVRLEMPLREEATLAARRRGCRFLLVETPKEAVVPGEGELADEARLVEAVVSSAARSWWISFCSRMCLVA